MTVGQRHISVGTIHSKAGHAIVFEKVHELEDTDGTKHVIKSENRTITWEDLQKVAAKPDLDFLESLGANLIVFEQRLEEIAKQEAARKKALEEAALAAKKAAQEAK